jgi:hypothetical protein
MKGNQGKYLSKVVELIVADTYVSDQVYQFPWMEHSVKLRGDDIIKTTFPYMIIYNHIVRDEFFEFAKFCSGNYGISPFEMMVIWEEYGDIITNKILNTIRRRYGN